MPIFDEPKVDCHAHIFDPALYPYQPDNPFHPAAGEIGTVDQLGHVMRTYGVRHVLLVQPNSGYGMDNSYLLQAIAGSNGRFKGVAKVPHDISLADLGSLKRHGILGVALNSTFEGLDYYRDAFALIEKLAKLDMFADIQVDNDDLLLFAPWLKEVPVKALIDHCGRPAFVTGTGRPEIRALLDLAVSGRVSIKISGFAKFSAQCIPFADVHAIVRSIIDAYTPEHCLWASDWPFLRPPNRQDYGPLVALAETFFPDPADRRSVFWDNPRRLFGFGTQ